MPSRSEIVIRTTSTNQYDRQDPFISSPRADRSTQLNRFRARSVPIDGSFRRNPLCRGLDYQGSYSISEKDATRGTRLGLDEFQRLSIPDARKWRFAAAEDDRVNDQPEFIYEAFVHQA
jgi:hypothetical protein